MKNWIARLITPQQRHQGMVSADGRYVFKDGMWLPIPFGGAVDMIQGNAAWHCDFLGPTGTTDTFFMGSRGGVHYVVASGATFGDQAANGGGGTITLAGDGADAVGVFGPLAYEPDEAGRMWMQARFRLSTATTGSMFIGFTDAITDTVVIEDEAGTINTVATDAFGLMLEQVQDATWQTMGVGNNTDDTQAVTTNIADLAAATYTTIHIEADSGGNAARTQLLVDGKPAHYDDPVVIVGAQELYEARCRKHHEVPRG